LLKIPSSGIKLYMVQADKSLTHLVAITSLSTQRDLLKCQTEQKWMFS